MFIHSKKQAGFTLVELLIVIVIIGILAAVAVPRFITASQNARNQTCRSNLSTLETAIADWAGQNSGSAVTPSMAILTAANSLARPVTCPLNNGAYVFAGTPAGGNLTVACPNAGAAGSGDHRLD